MSADSDKLKVLYSRVEVKSLTITLSISVLMGLKYQALKKFGLSEKEIKVYLEVLKHDEMSPYEISRATKIPRTTVYDILMGLSLKGLIELEQSGGITKQQTRVKARNPSVLREIVEQKKRELTNLDIDIVNILPELKKNFHKSETDTDFRFFPGIEGLKKVYFDADIESIKLDTYIWNLLMPDDVFGNVNQNKYIQEILATREKYKVKSKEIVPLNSWTKHCISYQFGINSDYIRWREMRFIDNPIFDVDLVIAVKGEYVRISCAKDSEMWGLTIKSKALSGTLVRMHRFMWLSAKPITPELVKSWGENEILTEQRRRRIIAPVESD